ncbi:titin [Corchorus capsularis]|uniref:Titin n=1 Tax=Corchorus capsularis TaxID=210143 RepID=A0A1R3GNR5_COCAP|nr:titin [Corchorus capsularis]
MQHPSTFQSRKPDIYSGQTLLDFSSAALFLARPVSFTPFHTEPSSRANYTIAAHFRVRPAPSLAWTRHDVELRPTQPSRNGLLSQLCQRRST